MHPSLQGSTIDNIQDTASATMSINREMKRKWFICTPNTLSHQQNEKMPLAAAWMDQEIYYTGWSQLEKEQEMYHLQVESINSSKWTNL